MSGHDHDRKASARWLEQHADSFITSAGWASLGLGLPLVVAPHRAAALIGLHESLATIRAFGILDLLLGCGLLSGHHPARWMLGRAVGNLILAVLCARALTNGRPARPQTIVLLVAMILLTGVDALAARHQRPTRK